MHLLLSWTDNVYRSLAIITPIIRFFVSSVTSSIVKEFEFFFATERICFCSTILAKRNDTNKYFMFDPLFDVESIDTKVRLNQRQGG